VVKAIYQAAQLLEVMTTLSLLLLLTLDLFELLLLTGEHTITL
jgi:hypothetical protein